MLIWKPEVTEILLSIYSGDRSFEDGMDAMQNALKEAAEDD